MAKLLFELGCEELPARFLDVLRSQLADNATRLLGEHHLQHGAIDCYATPRRLALVVSNLAECQIDTSSRTHGPWLAQAYAADGSPTKALLGFARSQELEIDQLESVEVDGKQRLAASRFIPGRPATAILPQLLAELIRAWKLPNSMRWGTQEQVFLRPVRWLCALLDTTPVEVSAFGLDAAPITCGHRFLAPEQIGLASPDDYLPALEQAWVIADSRTRRQLIETQIAELCAAHSLRSLAGEALLNELCGLVEYPCALLGTIDQSFMHLPREVLTTTLEQHQRYVCLDTADGQLAPKFICISNMPQGDRQAIIRGNERVLVPRLEDAMFFWKRDCDTSFAAMAKLLHEVVYEARLGSMLEKTRRLERLAAWLGKASGYTELDNLRQAASFSKLDLVSELVGELPELQGVVGGHLARHQGLDETIAGAIGEHYRPRFDGDAPPASTAGMLLALADKLDHLCGLFVVGKQGSAQTDPYGARRACLGVIQLLITLDSQLTLDTLIAQALHELPGLEANDKTVRGDNLTAQLMGFFHDRLLFWYQRQGVATSTILAVLAGGFALLPGVHSRVEFLHQQRDNPALAELAQLIKRIRNLRKNQEPHPPPHNHAFASQAERQLARLHQQLAPRIEQAIAGQEYAAYLDTCAQFVPALAQLFDEVMIVDGEAKAVAARLALLQGIQQSCSLLADFTRL